MLGHTRGIVGIDFSQDDRFLATVGADDTARVWDVESGDEVALVNLPNRLFTGVNFSRDGLSLLLRSTKSVLLWRCYACGDEKALLEEVDGRRIVRKFTPEEKQRFGVGNDPFPNVIPAKAGMYKGRGSNPPFPWIPGRAFARGGSASG